MERLPAPARFIEHSDGSIDIEIVIERTSGRNSLSRFALVYGALVLIAFVALAIWHAGRVYEREYGIDIHQSRWSR